MNIRDREGVKGPFSQLVGFDVLVSTEMSETDIDERIGDMLDVLNNSVDLQRSMAGLNLLIEVMIHLMYMSLISCFLHITPV